MTELYHKVLKCACVQHIKKAREAGITIDSGNVLDLCLDNLPTDSIDEIQAVLIDIGELPDPDAELEKQS